MLVIFGTTSVTPFASSKIVASKLKLIWYVAFFFGSFSFGFKLKEPSTTLLNALREVSSGLSAVILGELERVDKFIDCTDRISIAGYVDITLLVIEVEFLNANCVWSNLRDICKKTGADRLILVQSGKAANLILHG